MPTALSGARGGAAAAAARRTWSGRCSERDRPAVAEDRGVLDHVGQLADVARPACARPARASASGVNSSSPGRRRGRKRAQQVRGQLRNVVDPLAQRRQLDLERVDAEHQVFAKVAVGDHLFQVAVRGADHAHVDDERFVLADAANLAAFQKRAAAWPASPWAARRSRPETACRRWPPRTGRRDARRRR